MGKRPRRFSGGGRSQSQHSRWSALPIRWPSQTFVKESGTRVAGSSTLVRCGMVAKIELESRDCLQHAISETGIEHAVPPMQQAMQAFDDVVSDAPVCVGVTKAKTNDCKANISTMANLKPFTTSLLLPLPRISVPIVYEYHVS